jgi:hypothetical protein
LRSRRYQRAIVSQDALLQVPELRRRLQPELLDQQRAKLPVDLERVGVAAVAIEGQHLQRPHALLERLAARQRLELAEHLDVAAELEIALDARQLRGQTQLRQPRRLAGQCRPERDAFERLAPPHLQRLRKRGARAGRVAPAPGAVPGVRERLEAAQIQVGGLEAQYVAAGHGDDHLRAEGTPQPRDVHLHALRRCSGRVRPQLVDDALDRHGLSRVGEQQRQ